MRANDTSVVKRRPCLLEKTDKKVGGLGDFYSKSVLSPKISKIGECYAPGNCIRYTWSAFLASKYLFGGREHFPPLHNGPRNFVPTCVLPINRLNRHQ